MTARDLAALRTRLRAVNIEFSAVMRDRGSEMQFQRLAELKVQRKALMALLHGIQPARERRAPGALSARLRRRHVGMLQAAE